MFIITFSILLIGKYGKQTGAKRKRDSPEI